MFEFEFPAEIFVTVEVGTPAEGQDLKWNWVTVLVSPVRVFLRYTDRTR